MDSLSLSIIELLNQKDSFTSEEIGKILSVSERTVRNRIKEINIEIIQHGALINSLRGHGYHLEVINSDSLTEWLKEQYDEKLNIPNSSEERVNYLIDFLLEQKDYVYIDDLCDLLYVARNTLSSDLKKVEQEIRKYGLSIDRRPNHGIMVTGREVDKRLCIIDRITHNNRFFLDKLKTESVIMTIGDTLSREFHRAKYKTSIENYNVIRILTYVAFIRASGHFPIDYTEEEKNSLKETLPERMPELIKRILQDLGPDFRVLDDENEKLYLAIQFAGRGNMDEDAVEVVPADVEKLIEDMLEEVRKSLKIDLTGDFDLLMALRSHMTAMDIRMRYMIPLENPILETVRKKYSLAYALASFSCNYLSEHYGKIISEDEIGYIAIIYELALERKNRPVRKKNVVIVCAAGNSTSRFFAEKYREAFGDYLENLYECSGKDIEQFDFEGKKIDYCFTTLDADYILPVPCYKISLFPSEAEIRGFRNIFASADLSDLMSYYRRDLFLTHLHAKDKTDALNKIISFMSKRCELPDDFSSLIFQREKYGLTSFGTSAATPHPVRTCTKDNYVCVAILDEPVDWGNNDVQVIILLSLSTDETQDSRQFIQATSRFISNEEAIAKLIETRDFDEFLKLLSAEKE